MRDAPFDIAVMFIPPATAREAALDAIEAGRRGCSSCSPSTSRPQDVMAIHGAAARAGTRIVGPNTAGLVTPGEGFVGIMPGHNANIFRPGNGRGDLALAAVSAR